MAELVTLAQVKASLRMDAGDTDDDALLGQLIAGSTRMVIKYLKAAALPFLNEDGTVKEDANIPADIQTAAIILVGFLFKNYASDEDEVFDRGYLPKPVTAILYPHRVPTVA